MRPTCTKGDGVAGLVNKAPGEEAGRGRDVILMHTEGPARNLSAGRMASHIKSDGRIVTGGVSEVSNSRSVPG